MTVTKIGACTDVAPPAQAKTHARDAGDVVTAKEGCSARKGPDLARVSAHPAASPGVTIASSEPGAPRSSTTMHRDLEARSTAARGALGAGAGRLEVVQFEPPAKHDPGVDRRGHAVEEAVRGMGVDTARLQRVTAPTAHPADAGRVELRLVDADKAAAARVPSTASTSAPEKSVPPLDPLPGTDRTPDPIVLPVRAMAHVPFSKPPEAAPVPITQEASRSLLEALDAEVTVHPALQALRAALSPTGTAAPAYPGAVTGGAKTVALTGFALERLLQNPKASSLARRFLNGRALVLRVAGGAVKLQLVTGNLREGGVLHIGASNDPRPTP